MVKINGEEINLAKNTTLSDYIKDNGYDMSKIAVECNGNIIPKKEYDKKILADSDVIEIVTFVGGG